jgi:two-component system cell cycle sensor histidine kinase/response regulator CckA
MEDDTPSRERLIEELEEARRRIAELERLESERVEAVRALRESEERYRDLVEKSGIAILVDDEEGNVRYCNERFAALHGYTVDEVKEQPLGSLIHPDDAERVRTCHRAHMTGEPAPQRYEFRGLRKDGSVVFLEVDATPLRTDGRVVGTRSYFWDVSDRKRAGEAFLKEKAYLERLIESAPEAIVLGTNDGRVLRVNGAFETMFGYPEDEALGRNIDDLVVPPEARTEAADVTRRAGSGEKVALETSRLRKDGSSIAVSFLGAPIVFEGEQVAVFGIYRDISERQRLEHQLVQAQKIEAVGRLAGGVAHDFNNLLQAIMGESDLMLLGLEPDDPSRHSVEAIRTTAGRAAALTRQLLAFSRKQILKPRLLDINTLVADLEDMLHRLIGEDIELSTSLAGDLAIVRADPGQIEQVLVNLAVNARDAMPEGGHLSIETANVELDEEFVREHMGSTEGPHVRLAVADTGHGMDRETLSHIFEPFFTTKERGKGTGLGFATVYGIVKQSGGSVYVASEPGRGTTVSIYLPCVPGAIAADSGDAATPTPPTGNETVLLVEDDAAVRSSVKSMLELLGYLVLETTGPSEAVSVVESGLRPIHLLLTDVVMPGMSGRTLADRLTALRPELKVLYISGYTDDAVVYRGVLESGIAFLQKPFTQQALGAKVREVLDAASAGDRPPTVLTDR